jgi:hypothetical protein
MSDIQVISGTRRAMKEMADGTLRVQIDIDPRFRAQFFEAFGQIDMPVAIAPLVADFEKREPEQEKPKGGALATLAGRLCNDENFHQFAAETYGVCWRIGHAAEDIATWMREQCLITSRAELDHNEVAASSFHTVIRGPWQKWCQRRGLK